jgi:hypothetical protein
MEFLDGAFILDDPYYSLTIAKNIANGLGPSYGGQYTNGFQPLYVFMMVPVYMITKADLIAPIRASLVICSVIDTLTLLMLLKIFSKIASSYYTLILLCVLWILNFYVILNTLNCLETSLSLLFITVSLYYYMELKKRPNDMRTQIKLGAALGLAVFARLDNIFLIASILILDIIGHVKYKGDNILYIRKIGVILLTALLVYAPWVIYSYVYTGDIYQISGKAVRLLSITLSGEQTSFENFYVIILKGAGLIILYTNAILIGLIVLILLILISLGQYDKKRTLILNLSQSHPLILYGSMLFIVYVFYIFGYWYFYRYFYPLMLMFLSIALISFDYLNSLSIKEAYLQRMQIAIIVVVTAACIINPQFKNIFYDKERSNAGYMNIGLWASRSFKPGTIVGAAQSGAIGYFASNLNIINLDGVVNKECYEALKEKRYIEYIKDKKIEFIVGWVSSFQLIPLRSPNLREGDIIRMGKIKEFKTENYEWFLARVQYP